MSELLKVCLTEWWVNSRGACLSYEWIARGVCLSDVWIACSVCLSDEWIARGMSDRVMIGLLVVSLWVTSRLLVVSVWVMSELLVFAQGASLSDEWIARCVCLRVEWTVFSQFENPNHEFLHDDLQFCWKNHVSVPEEDKEYWKESPGEELGPKIRNQGHSQPYPGLGKLQKQVLRKRNKKHFKISLKYFGGLHLMIVQFVILLRRDFFLSMWQSPNEMQINPPIVFNLTRQRWSSTTFSLLLAIKYIFHTWQLLPFFRAATES